MPRWNFDSPEKEDFATKTLIIKGPKRYSPDDRDRVLEITEKALMFFLQHLKSQLPEVEITIERTDYVETQARGSRRRRL